MAVVEVAVAAPADIAPFFGSLCPGSLSFGCMLRMVRLASLLAVLAVVGAQTPGYPNGGGTCYTDDDCSLGGTCVDPVDNGYCQCDPWFTGGSVSLLGTCVNPVDNGFCQCELTVHWVALLLSAVR